MNTAAFFGCALVASALLAGEARAQITWRGEEFSADALPEALADLGPGPRSALDTWAPWALENDYRLAFSEDGRVLFVHAAKKRVLKKRVALVEDTLEAFDRILPLPPGRPSSGIPLVAAEPGTTTWSDDGPPLETETAVLFQVRTEADRNEVLDRCVAAHPYLAPWAATVRQDPGFFLMQPLVAAWAEEAPGQEEYDIENELVHRLTQLLLLRRFGPQPFWISMGVAWHVEEELRDSIFCFPYRNGFVFATEHSGWDRDLRNAYKKRDSLAFAEFGSWTRGSYRPDEARRAWGAITFLVRHRPGALASILEDLRALRDEKGIVHHGDGTWERIAGFEVPQEDQRAVFEKHAGEDFLAELLRFYQKGERFVPSKR